jgi:hypothetical protein
VVSQCFELVKSYACIAVVVTVIVLLHLASTSEAYASAGEKRKDITHSTAVNCKPGKPFSTTVSTYVT